MKKRILICLTVLTLSMASSMSVLAAPEVMPDGGVFDAEYYAQNNPDVVAVLGTDKNALYSHYVNSGKAEGRQGLSPEDARLEFPLLSKDKVNDYITNGYRLNHKDYIIFLASALRYGLAERLNHPCGLTFKYMYNRDKASEERAYPCDGVNDPYETFDTYMGYYIYLESHGIYAENINDINTIFAIKAQAKVKEDEIIFTNMNEPIDMVEKAALDCQDMLALYFGAEIEELNVYKQYATYVIEFKLRYAQ